MAILFKSGAVIKEGTTARIVEEVIPQTARDEAGKVSTHYAHLPTLVQRTEKIA